MNRRNIWLLLITVLLQFSVPALSKSSYTLLKREALTHMNAGRYGEAINVLDEIIAEDSKSADSYNLRGICYEKRSQFDHAVSNFRKATKLAPENKQFKQNLSRAENKWKKVLRERVKGYHRDLVINPNIIEHYYSLGECYEDLGQWTEAESWYDRYFHAADASSEQISHYTEVLAQKNQLSKGITLLEEYLDRQPDDYQMLNRYGYFLLWLGRFDEAYVIFERVLEIEPDFREAYEGLVRAQVKGFFTPEWVGDSLIVQPPSDQVIVNLYENLELDPYDTYERNLLVRELIKVKRFQEAFDQLEILSEEPLMKGMDPHYRHSIISRKDSVYQILLYKYSRKVEKDPTDRSSVLLLVNLYERKGDIKQLLKTLRNYLTRIPSGKDSEVQFKYAQYTAWEKKYKIALENLKLLLAAEPDNLDYQLLKGQILVWTVQNLDSAKIYLDNVYHQYPLNMSVILALASLHALEYNFVQSQEYLDLAKEIDPENKEIKAVQQTFNEAVIAYNEKKIYNLLEEARQLVEDGDCYEASKKYQAYLGQVDDSSKAVLLEYAYVNMCTGNFNESIRIYDAMLNEGYDFDVALLRAKAYLWRGDAPLALSELKNLSLQKPDHLESKLYSGDAYLAMGEYLKAKEIYQGLLAETSDPEQTKIIQEKMRYLPKTGFSGIISTFPRPTAFVPLYSQYSDNEGFQLNQLGSNLEAGVNHFLSLGASLIKLDAASSTDSRLMTSLKGRVFLKPFRPISISAGFGTLTSDTMSSKSISDLNLRYKVANNIAFEANFENTDAALLLYSPYLINLGKSAQLFRISGDYLSKSTLSLSFDYRHISVFDGNTGNRLRVRIGKKLYEEAAFGYEAEYLNYKFLASPIPGDTVGIKRLYYSPQNLDSHSLWFDWNLEKNETITFDINGKLGYIPSFDVLQRELEGIFQYRPLKNLNINVKMAVGNSHRYDSSYNFFSTSLSAYWRFY